ncbi:MAG: adenylate/guanylate cyclase domain-containing protein [Alphaproteobacteria bacterium]|nr:adenylate/guanylate cyclase domain-containing protein [Alphaproteobacteria bacterium]
MRRWVKGLCVGIATGLGGVVLAYSPLGADFETAVGLAWLYKARGTIEAPSDVVVVAINKRTARQLGLPEKPVDWPRSIHARLIDSLVERGASVIVFDLHFARPKSPEDDVLLADAIARAGRVVLVEKIVGDVRPLHGPTQNRGVLRKEQLVPPIPRLAAAAKGLGPFPLPKIDISVHQYWTFKASVGDAPTLPAVALQIYGQETNDEWLRLLAQFGANRIADVPGQRETRAPAARIRGVMRNSRLAFRADRALEQKIREIMGGGQGLSSKESRLFTALLGLYAGDDQRFLKFYGPAGTILTIPYHTFIAPIDAGADRGAPDLTNKAVFVGYSDLYEPDTPDRHATVFTGSDGVDLSGVEIAATAFGNLLTDGGLRTIGWSSEFWILLAIGGLLGVGVYLLPAMVGVPFALLVAALYAGTAQYAFNSADLWLPLATPVLAQLPMALLIGLLGQYALERRQKQLVTAHIKNYVPEHVASALTRSDLDLGSLDTVVHGTCLATDMSGFTRIAEGMPPKALAAFMNAYFEALSKPLIRNRVDVTEFRADAIMCAWDGSQADLKARERAVFAGLEVVDSINQFSQAHGPLDLIARVGLDDGPIYLGHAGGGGHFAYSILGDCANTASRIENLNKQLETHLLATEAVVAGLDSLLIRPLGRFQLFGKSDPSSVVEILAKKTDVTDEEIDKCARFAEALQAYNRRQWTEAATCFAAVLSEYPQDRPAHFYLERCRRYLKDEPSGDDPTIIRMESK